MTFSKNILTIISTILILPLYASEVQITAELNEVRTIHNGEEILITRVQNTKHKLNNNFAKTSRECPPFCIQPMTISKVRTVGELEVLDFIRLSKNDKSKMLIDARTTEWHKLSTIPSALNLPFLLLKENRDYIQKVLPILGAKEVESTWYFDHAYTLLIFGNGAWDSQANKAIEYLISINYPEDKLLYYRGGMQSWQSLGLTVK